MKKTGSGSNVAVAVSKTGQDNFGNYGCLWSELKECRVRKHPGRITEYSILLERKIVTSSTVRDRN